MERFSRHWPHLARLVAIGALVACAGVARATPITYLFSGIGSGSIGSTPFADAAYTVTLSGDTAAVSILSGFPFPGTVISNAVTGTVSVAGVGVATLTQPAVLRSAICGQIELWTHAPPFGSPAFGMGHDSLCGYQLQSALGPLVQSAPYATFTGELTDQGALTLSSSSDVTFLAVTTCGNGTLDAGEQCDDGNHSSGDCCSPSCQLEADSTACQTLCNPGGGTCQAGVCVGGEVDCNDDLPCTQDSCDEAIGCVHSSGPASGCLAAQQSRLLLKSSAVAGTGTLNWRWSKGAALAASDLADPTVDASYALCVYAGTPSALVAAALLPAGAKWSSVGTSGYRFKDSAPPTAVRLRAGAAGTSMASMAERGVTLEQLLPLDAPLIVQLRKSGSPLCLESQFAAPQRSDATVLKARTP
ncbi:MAG: myxococcus cysteine-rich repeat containing protein [bacterium]